VPPRPRHDLPAAGAAYDDAAECYLRAIDLYHDIGNRHPEAETLTSLGDTYQLAGHREAARGAWERAAAILDELGHASAAKVRARLEPPPG
jgi:tetratricopeptide (TPR) repeat protein